MLATSFEIRNLNTERNLHKHVKTLTQAIEVWKDYPTTATIWAHCPDGRSMIIQEPIK